VGAIGLQIAGYRTEKATAAQAEQLASIRVAAMRPSLEAVGRFDPERARERFLKSYCPAETEIIYANEKIVGFYVLRRRSDHLYLDHLYVTPSSQGHGIGRKVIEALKSEAQAGGLPIRLMALNGSPSNDFYRRNAFSKICADDLDTVYEWLPQQMAKGN